VRLVEALTQVTEAVAQVSELPPEAEREAGWLAIAVRTALANAYESGRTDAAAAATVPAPRAPRAAKPKPRADG
jgi:hypothetical protein